ncbi:MAG: serine/threonine protein kinase, partial [Kiritimatiellia bacterium]
MADTRPPHFPPGHPVGDRYTVEGLVRLAEGRMFYLANDVRHDLPEQGHQGRRYLMSTRWVQDGFSAVEQFHALGLVHPGLASPCDVFRYEDRQLVSVIPYNGEGLLLDEASPLPNGRILQIAQRIAGTIAFLHVNGVRLGPVTRANILISPDNSIRLFDLDIVSVGDQPVPDGVRSEELQAVGRVLRRFCNVEAEALAQFMTTVAQGEYPNPAEFGRAVEKRFDAFEALHYTPLLGAMTDVGLTRQL